MNALVKSLATPLATTQEHATARQLLTFAVAEDTYALPIEQIKEIIEYARPTAVPRMPGFIRGVINLRGAVVPVVDLGARFGGPRSEPTRRTCVVILELPHGDSTQVLGLLVDAVYEVIDLPGSEIEPAPAFGTRIRSDFIAGMARRGERFVVVLDPIQVLSVDELAQLDVTHEPEACPA